VGTTNWWQRWDACQRRKEEREFVAPLGDVDQPSAPFEVTAMDITGPYVLTLRKNKYVLTFIDHFTKYVEAVPISDQSAETCTRVYASQLVTRHGTGSKLITDQGRTFMSTFCQETCKILGIHKVNITSHRPSSNGMTERLHRTLHTGRSYFVNSANNNWDVLVHFFLMAYTSTPNTTTKYSPFYLLHGREMPLPTNENLKLKFQKKIQAIANG
jgi:transposase InsO family protein